jgi:arylsulfatase A-like enzyme
MTPRLNQRSADLVARCCRSTLSVILGATVSTLIELTHVWRYFPAAVSDPAGYAIYVANACTMFLIAGIPAFFIGFFFENAFQRMIDRITAAHTITVVAGTILAIFLLHSLHGIFDDGQVRSFSTHIDRIVVIGEVAILLFVVLFALLAIYPACSWLMSRFSLLNRPRGVLVVCGFAVSAVLTGLAAGEFFSIHLDVVLPALTVVSVTLFIVCVHLIPGFAAIKPRATSVLPVLALLLLAPPPLSMGNPHSRFVLFQQSPLAGSIASTLDDWLDFDGDGTSSRFTGGTDCDEFNARINPTRREVPGDGVDQDCTSADEQPTAFYRDTSIPLLSGCRYSAVRPSILLLTVDALRFDSLRPEVMYNLSRFAKKATVFSRAISPSAFTEYSFLSLFAGRPLSDLLVDNPMANQQYCAPQMFPEALQTAGYRTAMYSHVILPKAVFRGISEPNHYEHAVDANDGSEFGENAPHRSAAMTRQIIDFISSNNRAPYFLWAHYTDLHAPYNLDIQPANAITPLTPYEKEAAYVDYHLGRLLEALSKMDSAQNTIIVITSDHGEELMNTGREGHGTSGAPHSVHVPLLMWIPGCPPRNVSFPSSLTDLSTTLLSLAGLPQAGPMLSLKMNPPRPAVSETFERKNRGHRWIRSVFFGDFHLLVDVLHGGRMLFNVNDDPNEETDLYHAMPVVATQMESIYLNWLNRPEQTSHAECIPGVDQDGPQSIQFGNTGP